jgi:hypothetical protein
MKVLSILVLLGATLLPAQKNSLTLYAVGQFNSTDMTYIPSAYYLPMPSHNASKAGGGAEYMRALSPTVSAGVWFETNRSDGSLLVEVRTPSLLAWQGWPLEEYNFAALAEETFWHKARWQPFLQEGFGFIVTQSLVRNSGWSADPAPFYGGGVGYRLSKHWKAKVGMLVWDSRTGCYDDPACTTKGSFAVGNVPRLGLEWAW